MCPPLLRGASGRVARLQRWSTTWTSWRRRIRRDRPLQYFSPMERRRRRSWSHRAAHKCIYCIAASRDVYRAHSPAASSTTSTDRPRGVNSVQFFDDTFTVSRRRVLEICQLVARPAQDAIRSAARVNSVDREMLTALKRAGCTDLVRVEAARTRRSGAAKHTNRQARRAFALCKEVGIETLATSSSAARPDETRRARDIDLALELDPSTLSSRDDAFPGTILPAGRRTDCC